MSEFMGRPLRTPGCIILYGTAGCAVVECNFTEMVFRKDYMAVIFSDTLFSIKKVSAAFEARFFELSAAMTDETTFTSGNALLDWLSENPVLRLSTDKKAEMDLWLAMMDWIEANTVDKYQKMMLRNHWQNFFLALESELSHWLAVSEIHTISQARKIFGEFCRLLGENCRKEHGVRFYADRLCITPCYLSQITRRIFAVSPKELVDRQIVMEIKSLLISTEMSVKEIAEEYNFESSSYLGRYLRRHTGMTPSEFRKHNC